MQGLVDRGLLVADRPNLADQFCARRRAPRASFSGRSHSQCRCDGSLGEVTLLDYGAGNVRSVRNAIKKIGYTIKEVC
jgi:hypothetical protein